MGALGLWRRGAPDAVTKASRYRSASLPDPAVVPSGSLAQLIAGLQARARALPKDWDVLASLGLAYVQQARVTADPTYYPKAEAVLTRSLQLNDVANFHALVGMAALGAARHDFAGALAWGRRAEAVNPDNGNVYDVIGDALIELGRYPEAIRDLPWTRGPISRRSLVPPTRTSCRATSAARSPSCSWHCNRRGPRRIAPGP